MIIVPRTQAPGVAVTPSNNRKFSLDTPPGAFSSGIVPVAEEVAKLFQKEMESADLTAVMEADVAAGKMQADLDARMRQTHVGKDAAGAGVEADREFKKGLSEISEGLSRNQQGMFDRSAAQRRTSLNATLEHHASNEIVKHRDQVATSAIQSSVNEAITGSGQYGVDSMASMNAINAIGTALAKQEQAIRSMGTNRGFTEEMIKQEIAVKNSTTHVGVIANILAGGNDLSAAEYYKNVKGQIVGEDDTKIVAALDIGSTRGESQREFDRITAMDSADQQAAARDIKNPKIREATITLLDQQNLRDKKRNTEIGELNYLNATNLAEKAGSVNAIPPADWAELNVHERSSIISFINNKEKGTQPETDYALLTNLYFTPTADVAKISAAAMIRDYRPNMSDSDYKNAVNYVTNMRDSLAAGNQNALTAGQGFNDMVLGSYLRSKDYGGQSSMSTDDKKEFIIFKSLVSVKIQEFEQQGKGTAGKNKSTDAEQQQIANGILANKSIHIPNRVFPGGEDKALEFVTKDEQGKAIVKFNNITPVDRAGFVKFAREKGVIPPNATDAEATMYLRSHMEKAMAMLRFEQRNEAAEYLSNVPKYIKRAK